MKGPSIGYAYPKDTSLINRHLNKPEILSLFPEPIEFKWSYLKNVNELQLLELIAIKRTRNEKSVLTAKNLKGTKAEYSNYGEAIVAIQFDEQGSVVWEEFTKKNIGRAIAITINDVVFSAPIVNSEIVWR
jgi:SecD/SecF fusion protein